MSKSQQQAVKRLRWRAAQIGEDVYDMLCTYNRMYDASNGTDARLARLDADMTRFETKRRALLAQARMIEGGRAA